MSISGVVEFSGRLKYTPPVPSLDSSVNPTWLADVLEQMGCSARKEEEYKLTVDGDTSVDFGSLASSGANVVILKVSCCPPNTPIVAKLSSSAGAAQAVSVDGFLCVFSRSVPYTALTIARPPGVEVTVRAMLFAVGS